MSTWLAMECPWNTFPGVSVRVFLDELALELVELIKSIALAYVGGHHFNPRRA